MTLNLDIQVNGLNLDFDSSSSLVQVADVLPGAQNTRSACTDLDPCDQAVSCNDTYYNDYMCVCKFGYRGKNCSEPDFCSYGTCPNESTCVNLRSGYECVGVASFSQDMSVISYSMTDDLVLATSGSDLDLTFSMRTRGRYGLIFQLREGPYHVSLRVARGHLEVNYKLKAGEFEFSQSVGTTKRQMVNDGKWYSVRFQVTNSTHFQLHVYANTEAETGVISTENGVIPVEIQPQLLDNITLTEFSPRDPGIDLTAMLQASGNTSELLLGGPDAPRSSPLWEAGFNGCLREARIGEVLLPYYVDETFANNSNSERFLAQKVVAVTHDCRGRDVCGVGGPGYLYCGNGGRCVDEWNSFRCQCPRGYSGKQCEEDQNECSPDPCRNQGNCVDGPGTYTCDCLPGFTGNQ
ncbi:protein crumbs-like [Plakobranchus ocellatus]|uniref:Protein crumbs-like n=1 Tax=Plakobranchus ocellatus TaxID=259542 RepID=A0AAV4D700_9GAST|nr:protein crumbs-like [Plakobranchus ocellatus]